MAATREQLRRLGEPFDPRDIEWRVQQAGEKNGKPWARVLAYVTNRAIMQRLDDVVGPENWQDEFRAGPAGGVLGGIGILCERTGEGGVVLEPAWHWKWDGAENTDVEPVKGGLSNAMKRAAVKWGLGRYMYDLDETWAKVHDGGANVAKTKEGRSFRWDPPDLPGWAQPALPRAASAQLARIEALLPRVDLRTAARLRKRLAEGLTPEQADDAIRYLEGMAEVPEAEPKGPSAPSAPVDPVVAAAERAAIARTTRSHRAVAATAAAAVPRSIGGDDLPF